MESIIPMGNSCPECDPWDVAFTESLQPKLSNHQYVITSSLDDIERMVDPSMFYRANRQFLINKATVDNAERFFQETGSQTPC